MRLQGVIIAQITAQYEQWLERAKPHLDRLLILYLSFSMAGLIFTQCDWRDAEIPLDQRSPQREMMGAYTDSSIDSSTDSSTDSSSAEARDVASHQAEIDRGANHQGEQEQGQEQVLDPQEDGQPALNHSPDGLAPLAPPPIPHLSAPKIRPALESIGASTLGRDKRGHDQSQRDQSQRDQSQRDQSQRDQSQRDQSQGEQPRNRALQVLSIEFSTARRSRTRAPRTFKRSTSKITMSITIRNKHKPQRLHIRWLRLNRSQQIDHLYVKYSSRYTLTTPLELDRYHERDGAWRVEIRSESGELIGEASFKVQ